ncbi:unnamed protein product [Schistosoma rodhaini]|uniref:EGF-like domain-containing protein n=1 Tax=Schistosoma rodhaini TaxID=6188 RepID=A0AA85FR41_9TREM|nr:unnamed protein product [Schistosoma rodhaini]
MKFYLTVLFYYILEHQMNGILFVSTESKSTQLTSKSSAVSPKTSSQMFYHDEAFRKKSCVIFEGPQTCDKIVGKKAPLYTHFMILIEMSDNEMNPLSVEKFNAVPENQRYEHFAKRSCKFIMEQVTTEKMPQYERPHCSVVKYIPSDQETMFAVTDIVYDSIKATQLSDETLLGTLKQNNKFHVNGQNFSKAHVKILSNTVKRTCEDCQSVCPRHSYCSNTMNGISCTCKFGWKKVGGYSRSEYCTLHPISIILIVIGSTLMVVLTILAMYFSKRVTITKYLRRVQGKE